MTTKLRDLQERIDQQGVTVRLDGDLLVAQLNALRAMGISMVTQVDALLAQMGVAQEPAAAGAPSELEPGERPWTGKRYAPDDCPHPVEARGKDFATMGDTASYHCLACDGIVDPTEDGG